MITAMSASLPSVWKNSEVVTDEHWQSHEVLLFSLFVCHLVGRGIVQKLRDSLTV